jgi:hypothetical protein
MGASFLGACHAGTFRSHGGPGKGRLRPRSGMLAAS